MLAKKKNISINLVTRYVVDKLVLNLSNFTRSTIFYLLLLLFFHLVGIAMVGRDDDEIAVRDVSKKACQPFIECVQRAGIALRIAAMAAAMVAPGDVVLIDAGPITAFLAEALADRQAITVITNSIGAIEALRDRPRLTDRPN